MIYKIPTCYKEITKDYLDKLFIYDSETGIIAYRFNYGRIKAGTIAKYRNNYGYLRLRVGTKLYVAQKLIWLMMTGEHVPENRIVDHIDRNPKNDAWLNYRLGTTSNNGGNAKVSSANTSGYKGVYWNKLTRKWIANICRNGKMIYLGSFKTPEDASDAYNKAALEYFGEFANF
jgi:hypothetical protein